jgi:hypothetical protein
MLACFRQNAREWIRLATFLAASIVLIIGLAAEAPRLSSSGASSSSSLSSGSSSSSSPWLRRAAGAGASPPLTGDGMVTASMPLALASWPLGDGTPPEGPFPECDRADETARPPVLPEDHFSSSPLTWYGAGGKEWSSGDLRLREAHRFTRERAFLMSAYKPALDVPHAEHLHMMSPAMAWVGDRLKVFLRVSNYPDELYDNFIFEEDFTQDLQPVEGSARVVGVPTHSAPLMAPGPEDPRSIVIGGKLLINYNLQFRNNDRRMVLMEHATGRMSTLEIAGLPQQRAEKNWMPFVHEGSLHFIYQLDPLVILRCEHEGEDSGRCTCVVPECNGQQYNTRKALARGGTGLTPIPLPGGGGGGDSGLLFGLIHSTFGNLRVGDHAIRGHFVLVSTRPWGVVAVSSSLVIPESLKSCYQTKTVPWDVQFPSSFAFLGGDERRHLVIGVHVRDAMSALLVADLGEPLRALLAQAQESLCEDGGSAGAGGGAKGAAVAAGACRKWKVLKDGEVDATLTKGIIE